jgi:hypothetical protein
MRPDWTWSQDRQRGSGKVLSTRTTDEDRCWTIDVQQPDAKLLGVVFVRERPDGELACSIRAVEGV